MFIHFGPYTWYPYDKIPYNAFIKEEAVPYNLFNPTNLDCNQWVELAKNAGLKHIILTVKHQDGFCLWPTNTSSPSVATIPWENGKRDIVKEYVDACRKNDIKIGFYCGLLDLTGNKNEIDHIEELLYNYGKIDYIFFDGYGTERRQYDFAQIGDTIRVLQPDIIVSNGMSLGMLIFGEGEPDVGWIGNEEGVPTTEISYDTEYNFAYGSCKKELRYIIPSAYVRVRGKYWFYDNGNNDILKSVDDLKKIYDLSYCKGTGLSINVAPDRSGLIPDDECQLLLNFSKVIKNG